MLGLAAGRDGGQRPPVEGALAGDHPVAPGGIVFSVVLADHLEPALDSLTARVGEEDRIGKAVVDQTLGEARLSGDVVQVGRVPDLARLLGERLDQMRVAMAERRHRDAGAEIKVAAAVRVMDVGALALLKGEVGTRVRRHDGGYHDALLE